MIYENKSERDYALIKVVGIGDEGCITVKSMAPCNVKGIELITASFGDEDSKCFTANAPLITQPHTTEYLIFGGIEDENIYRDIAKDTYLLILITCIDNNCNLKATSMISRIAKKQGVSLTIAIITKQFYQKVAIGLNIAKEIIFPYVDSLIFIKKIDLHETINDNVTFENYSDRINKLIRNIIKGIHEPLTLNGEIGVDFSDYRTIFYKQGFATPSIGFSRKSSKKGHLAAEMAIKNLFETEPLSKVSRNVFVSICTSRKTPWTEIADAISVINNYFINDPNVLIGAPIDQDLSNEIRVTIIATGYKREETSFDY